MQIALLKSTLVSVAPTGDGAGGPARATCSPAVISGVPSDVNGQKEVFSDYLLFIAPLEIRWCSDVIE